MVEMTVRSPARWRKVLERIAQARRGDRLEEDLRNAELERLRATTRS